MFNVAPIYGHQSRTASKEEQVEAENGVEYDEMV
jgi:hypothetical protein